MGTYSWTDPKTGRTSYRWESSNSTRTVSVEPFWKDGNYKVRDGSTSIWVEPKGPIGISSEGISIPVGDGEYYNFRGDGCLYLEKKPLPGSTSDYPLLRRPEPGDSFGWGDGAGYGGSGWGSGGAGHGGSNSDGTGNNGSMGGAGEDFDEAKDDDDDSVRDPLMLDLNGDGIKTISASSGAFFDHDGDGFAEQTGWVDSNDGLLVMDRNGDGVINDGKELFGDQTVLSNGKTAANGFEALTDLDSNDDGKIDGNDEAFSQLKVWKDSDADGYSLTEELHTLEELGITSINLSSTISNITDEGGNTQNRQGSFDYADGTSGQIAEYSVEEGTTDTIPNDWVDVPADIYELPDLRGYGTVYDLHQAMAMDSSCELKSLWAKDIQRT
jgi:hypothetical protein